MLNSLRAKLLLWYALILAAVIAIFSTTLYVRLWTTEVQKADSELQTQARRMARALSLRIEGEEGEDEEGPPAEVYLREILKSAPEGIGLCVWDAKGAALCSSPAMASLARPANQDSRFRGTIREVIIPGPDGALVLAGKDMQADLGKRQDFLRLLWVVGGGVFAFAMAGGWFLAGRALAPIKRMSQTASLISASDMSRRIDVGSTENELGRLASTLNGTFDRLEAAFDRQTRFTADASHELRTPLSILMTNSEVALKKERTSPEYRETIETCLKAAQRMKAVVEGLLTLARADAREGNLRPETLDLKAVVDEAGTMLSPLASERKIVMEIKTEPVEVSGDRARLGEVAVNLLTNAIRYNREGGRVDAVLRTEAGEAVLTVTDTGIGIPPQDQPHIFERFYRVEKARSRELGGSGLGLAIARWVVEAHGGTISFTSREGAGTTFTVRLPRKSG